MSVHQCSRCELRFRTESEYTDHLRMEHGVKPESLDPIRYGGSGRSKPLYPDFGESRAEGTHRVLIVGNATLRAQRLEESLRQRSGEGATKFMLVVPAVDRSAVHGEHSWFETVGSAHPDERSLTGERLAEHRMKEAVARMRDAGIDIEGMVGHGDPMQAAQEALRRFEADEILLATLPRARSSWLSADLPTEMRQRYRLPVTVVEAS